MAKKFINPTKVVTGECRFSYLVPTKTKSESQIAVQSTQFQYGVDYFVGDFVTVEHRRFGIRQNKIQLVGMIESFDHNGRNLTPTFKEA